MATSISNLPGDVGSPFLKPAADADGLGNG